MDNWKEAQKNIYKMKLTSIEYDERPSAAEASEGALAHLSYPTKDPYVPEIEQYCQKEYAATEVDINAPSPVKEM